MNVKKLRLEIAKTIKNNLKIMNKNPIMIKEIADCIVLECIESNNKVNQNE